MNGQLPNCESLREQVKEFSLVRSCDIIRNGTLRISTPFSYPNGSHIDVFLGVSGGLFSQYFLSDYGQTTDYLADMQIKPWATRKRRILIDDICKSLGVQQRSGAFEIDFENNNLSSLPHAMVRLSQACIRVADLAFTQRMQTSGTFQEEVEEFIAWTDLPYEPDIELVGAFGKPVKVDFRVQGQAIISLVQTFSTPYAGTAHLTANEIFRRWYDLNPYRTNNQFITVFDTSNRIFREDDLRRLSDFSLVLGFPEEQDEIQEVLAA
jgi:hypothetical protein